MYCDSVGSLLNPGITTYIHVVIQLIAGFDYLSVLTIESTNSTKVSFFNQFVMDRYFETMRKDSLRYKLFHQARQSLQ